MGTQIQPGTVVETQVTPPVTPPVEGQTTPPADNSATSNQPSSYDARFDQIERQLADSRRVNERLLDMMDKANAPKPTPPTPTPDAVEFFKDPARHIERIIDSKLDKTIAPLQQFTQQYEQERKYDQLKQVMRATYGDKFTQLEGTVDQIFIQNKWTINQESMYAAFAAAYGANQLGSLSDAPAQPSRPSVPNTTIVPPTHVPSSPAPDGRQTQPPVQLTETEKLLFAQAKRGHPNMTEADWVALRDGGTRGYNSNMTFTDKVVAKNA